MVFFSPSFSPTVAGNIKRQAVLLQSTLYRMELLIHEDHNASHSKPCSWLMKVEEDPNSGEIRLLDPVTNAPLLRYEFNQLDFRAVELRKSYLLKATMRDVTTTEDIAANSEIADAVNLVQKVVVIDNDNVHGAFIIFKRGKLGLVRMGDEKLTIVDDGKNSNYHDMIIYKGQCYVVDNWGEISSCVNSALEVSEFSPPLSGRRGQKHLMESCGDPYLVVQYFATMTSHGNRKVEYPHQEDDDAEAIDFKVYKLIQAWAIWWEDMTDLGDQVFILSNDGSFSVSSKEFAGVKGNCIFFIDRVVIAGVTRRFQTYVFSVENFCLFP